MNLEWPKNCHTWRGLHAPHFRCDFPMPSMEIPTAIQYLFSILSSLINTELILKKKWHMRLIQHFFDGNQPKERIGYKASTWKQLPAQSHRLMQICQSLTKTMSEGIRKFCRVAVASNTKTWAQHHMMGLGVARVVKQWCGRQMRGSQQRMPQSMRTSARQSGIENWSIF